MSSRPRLAQLFIWQGWTLLAALVPSLTVSLLWTPGTRLWKLATVLWVILWVLRVGSLAAGTLFPAGLSAGSRPSADH